MDVSKFNEKLNKLDSNIYTFEEEVTLTNGVYEAELAHDNVNLTALNIYTGSKLTGDKVNTYTTSTPSLTPWKTVIKIYSNISPLYISYETTGDTVEADDINNVQDAIVDTQNNLNNEVDRAKGAEKVLIDDLNAETYRATNAEKVLENNLNAEALRAKASENTITNTINTNKPNWDDKYSRNEVDNKFNVLATNMDWKESVATFNDIVTTYPTPDDGWTVNTKDTDITYRYSGSAWIPISANSIPLATKDVDGKMSKQDKIDHDDMNSKKHTHSNKGILDVITQTLLDTWNAAYTHISDTVKHITQDERNKWNTTVNTVTSGTVNNADKLDGKHASDFAPSGYGLGTNGKNIDGTDLNLLQTTGFYIGSLCTNAPNNGWFYFIVISHTDINWTWQYALSYGAGNIENIIYSRVKKDGTWTSWSTQYSTSNKPTPVDIGASPSNHVHDDRYYTETESDNKFATKDQISQAGYGDMLKSVYDKDGNGIVDKATITHRLYRHDYENEDVYYISPYWTGNTNGWRIGAYNTSSDEQTNIHKVSVDKADYADYIKMDANKPATDLPSTWATGMYYTQVYSNGYPCTYGSLLTIKGTSGESAVQLCLEWSGSDGGRGGAWIRSKRDCGVDVWSPWSRLWSEKSKPLTWNDLEGV